MSTEHSVDGILAVAEAADNGDVRHPGTVADMLRAYAKRIEADESAVPVAWVADLAPEIERSTDYMGIFTPYKNYADHLATYPDYVVTPLFTHPPAQAAQVDKPPRFGGCCCGEPCTLGVVHRTDGPCFVYDAPTAEPAQAVDAERKYKWLCDTFDGMKTSASERFLECLGIEGDVCKAFDDLLTSALTEKGNG